MEREIKCCARIDLNCRNYLSDKPHNPLINSGAIMSASLLLNLVQPDLDMSETYDLVMEYFRKMAGKPV